MTGKEALPKCITKILAEAPLAYCLVVLSDYRAGKKTAKQLKKEWIQYKINQNDR